MTVTTATGRIPVPTKSQPVALRPPQKNILEVVRQLRADLRKSDRKVADIVIEQPQTVMKATVAETAELAGVSQPTVIRFCSAVGCSGFQDLKLRLAQSLALGTPATHSVLLNTDDPGGVVDKVFDYTVTSLDWARHHLDRERLGQAIGLLEHANAIQFFGYGASGIVAADGQQKFPLFGVPCGVQVDSHQQIMTASMMRPGDVAVVISNTGMSRGIIEVARTARVSGAKVIGITGGDSPLVTHCDVALIVETLDNTNIYTPTISRIAALVVIDVLSTAVALRRTADHLERVLRMKRRLNELRFSEGI
jgi:RpiR family carbohydrate utilization transcriptional regulator